MVAYLENFLMNMAVKEFILKIGSYLPKLWLKIKCLVFWDTV